MTDRDTDPYEAFARLYALDPDLKPANLPAAPAATRMTEQAALTVIKWLEAELLQASVSLHEIADVLKMQPNFTPPRRLALANVAIKASRRAREAAGSVQG